MMYFHFVLQAVAFFKYLQTLAPSEKLRPLFTMAIVGVAGVVFLAVCGLTLAGVIAPWSGRYVLSLFTLFDTLIILSHELYPPLSLLPLHV